MPPIEGNEAPWRLPSPTQGVINGEVRRALCRGVAWQYCFHMVVPSCFPEVGKSNWRLVMCPVCSSIERSQDIWWCSFSWSNLGMITCSIIALNGSAFCGAIERLTSIAFEVSIEHPDCSSAERWVPWIDEFSVSCGWEAPGRMCNVVFTSFEISLTSIWELWGDIITMWSGSGSSMEEVWGSKSIG